MQHTIPISKSLYFKLLNFPTLISHIINATRLTAIIHREAGLIHALFFTKPTNNTTPLISKMNVTNDNKLRLINSHIQRISTDSIY